MTSISGSAAQDIKVGQYMTIEGGVGRSFIKGAASAGMAYVMQWKTTDDSGADIPPLLPRGKNKAYGLGPEINMPFFAKGKFVGLLGFRYTFEFANSTNFQGRNLALTLTLAKLNDTGPGHPGRSLTSGAFSIESDIDMTKSTTSERSLHREIVTGNAGTARSGPLQKQLREEGKQSGERSRGKAMRSGLRPGTGPTL